MPRELFQTILKRIGRLRLPAVSNGWHRNILQSLALGRIENVIESQAGYQAVILDA